MTLDARVFVLLVGFYGIVVASRFGDPLASGAVLFLAATAIGAYARTRDARARQWLAFAAIAAIAIAPTVLAIYLRRVTAPYEFIHDGAIQTEEAVKFLLAGKNPYVEDYLNTPMAQWHWSESDLKFNPALYHLPYFPFLLVSLSPFYLSFQSITGWFDARLVYLLMFLAILVLVPRLTRDDSRQRALLLWLGLNPLFVPYLAEGRNDVFVLFWLIAGIALLRAHHPILSAIPFAFACATKQTAWFLVPFYFLASSAISPSSSSSSSSFISRISFSSLLSRISISSLGSLLSRSSLLSRQLAAFILTFFVLVAPFFLWNSDAFIDDLFRFNAGTTAYSYPIKSYGLGGILLALGIIKSGTAYFPFDLFQLAFALPALLVLLRYQLARNTLPRMWLAYASLALVVAFCSRIFNDNHLGFILSLYALGFLSDE